MHDARAGEVDDSAQVGVLVDGRCPAVRVPHPVHDHGVDEAGDDLLRVRVRVTVTVTVSYRGVHDERA